MSLLPNLSAVKRVRRVWIRTQEVQVPKVINPTSKVVEAMNAVTRDLRSNLTLVCIANRGLTMQVLCHRCQHAET